MIDQRHEKRVRIVQSLFSQSFGGKEEESSEEETVGKILKNKDEIDPLIEKYASRYPIQKIAKMDLAILRLSIWELMFDRKNPEKVVIDEAVELAKEFGNEKSYAFVNGVLGSILSNHKF